MGLIILAHHWRNLSGRIHENEFDSATVMGCIIQNDTKGGTMVFKKMGKDVEIKSERPDEEDPLTKYFDGMGTATARIIIKRHIDDNQWEKYGFKDLKNTGRYYIARMVEKDVTVIDEVLVDKQSGTIQSLRGHTGSGDLKR